MSGYIISEINDGKMVHAGESESAVTALGIFRTASRGGRLPIDAIRIVDPAGQEIDVAELAVRAAAERNA